MSSWNYSTILVSDYIEVSLSLHTTRCNEILRTTFLKPKAPQSTSWITLLDLRCVMCTTVMNPWAMHSGKERKYLSPRPDSGFCLKSRYYGTWFLSSVGRPWFQIYWNHLAVEKLGENLALRQQQVFILACYQLLLWRQSANSIVPSSRTSSSRPHLILNKLGVVRSMRI